MSPSHLSPSQGGSAAPAPAEEIWVLRKPFTGTASARLGPAGMGSTCQDVAVAPAGHGHTTASPDGGAQSPDSLSSLCAGGDRSSLGSTGSVASARSSGSGQSAGSGAHALHAGSEGVKVRRAPRQPCQLLCYLAAVLQRLLLALTSARTDT